MSEFVSCHFARSQEMLLNTVRDVHSVFETSQGAV